MIFSPYSPRHALDFLRINRLLIIFVGNLLCWPSLSVLGVSVLLSDGLFELILRLKERDIITRRIDRVVYLNG
jgi:hypothetical protein